MSHGVSHDSEKALLLSFNLPQNVCFDTLKSSPQTSLNVPGVVLPAGKATKMIAPPTKSLSTALYLYHTYTHTCLTLKQAYAHREIKAHSLIIYAGDCGGCGYSILTVGGAIR